MAPRPDAQRELAASGKPWTLAATLSTVTSISYILVCLLFFLIAASSCGRITNRDEDSSKTNAANPPYGLEHYENGKKLFRTNCAACHSMPHVIIDGPNIFIKLFQRLPDPPESYFRKFVMDGKSLKQSGDSYLRRLEEMYQINCTHDNHDKLTPTELEEILLFLQVANKANEK